MKRKKLFVSLGALLVAIVAIVVLASPRVEAHGSGGPTITNMGLAMHLGEQRAGERFFAFTVPESQTTGDLNNDGDIDQFERVIHIWDSKRRRLYNLELAGAVLTVISETKTVQFAVRELKQGNLDLNGDGDTDDFVFHEWRK